MSALLSLAADAGAQGASGPHLAYRAPEGCADEAAFRGELRARTARDLDDPAAPSFAVTITTAEPVHGSVVIRGADGSETVRDVHGATCAEVTSALAVITAVVLDGRFETAGATAPGASTPDRQPPDQTAPEAAAPAASARAQTESAPAPRLGLGVHGAGISGTGSGLRFGPRLVGEATFSDAGQIAPSVRVSFLWTPSATGTTSAGEATLSFMAGRAEACPFALLEDGAVSLAPCATFDVGRIAGEGGSSALRPAAEPRLWLAPGVLLRLAAPVADFLDVELEGGAEVPLFHYRFRFEPSPVAYEADYVVGTAGVGIMGGFGEGWRYGLHPDSRRMLP